ncbi:MAG: outer membrane beta-barrel protein [Akkermansiaceae bacterium]
MNFIKYTAAATLLSGVASAQGLFDVNPNESDDESSPLRYTAGVSFGYDDNVNPTTAGPEDSSSYIKGSLGANLVVRGEQTSWDLNANLGVTNYFDDVTTDDTIYNGNVAFNLNHRINDRTRFVSRNFFNYGLDLGNFYGPITSRQVEEYTYFSTDNAIGYRWTDRFATYTGIAFSMLDYDGSASDVDSLAIYNQFRYTLNEQTTLTANVRYTMSDYNSDDSDRVTTSVGFEHRLTDASTVVAEVGAQFGDQTSAYGSFSYNNQVNTQLRARVFARYSQEDTDTIFFGDRYEDKTTLRIGAAADYTLSPQVTLTIGGNYTMSDYKEASFSPDGDWDLFNIYVGATYKINDALSVRASANHSTSDATNIPNREYDRNRYEVGVNYAF